MIARRGLEALITCFHQWLGGTNPYLRHIGSLADNLLWTKVQAASEANREAHNILLMLAYVTGPLIEARLQCPILGLTVSYGELKIQAGSAILPWDE